MRLRLRRAGLTLLLAAAPAFGSHGLGSRVLPSDQIDAPLFADAAEGRAAMAKAHVAAERFIALH